MSFLGSMFSGASNQYTPPGLAASQGQAATANTNYGQANTGLSNLASALTTQMNGGGPNLANAQLQSATGQNVANQAALGAGQRGAAGNVGLMARQIGQQGQQIQQQAAGQSAQNVLAQQLAAQQQLAGVLGTQGSLANQNYGTAQSGVTAGSQIGANAAAQNTQGNQQLLSGLGGAAMQLLAADGGQVPHMADGGDTANPFSGYGAPSGNSPYNSAFNFNFLNQRPAGAPPPTPAPNMTNQGVMPGTNGTVGVSQRQGAGSGIRNQGGFDPNQGAAGQAPTPVVSGPMQDPTQNAANGGMILPFAPRQAPSMTPNGQQGLAKGGPINFKPGGSVPGQPMKPGINDIKQDTVPAMLTPKEIVLPLTVTQHPDAPQKAADFVANIKAKDGGSDQTKFKDALSRSIKSRRKK